MIVDLHRHLWSIFERYPAASEAAARGRAFSSGTRTAGSVPDVTERTKQIRTEMFEAGVDRSVLLLADYGLRLGEGALSIDAENRRVTDLAREDPDHFIAFCGVDPRRPDAVQVCQDAIDAGALGIKLHPSAGFYPNDTVCWPLYDLAGERGVPVAIHTGPMAAPLLSEYANPIYLDEPAAVFPDTNFIMLHAGQRSWFPLALDIARWKPNVYLELSLWQTQFLESEARFAECINLVKMAIGLGRVIFGSDCPGSAAIMPLARWVRTVQELPAIAQRHGYYIAESDVEKVLGGTAATLLGLV